MATGDKVRTRSAAEISEIIQGVMTSSELKAFINDAVKLAIAECVNDAVSAATKELKIEILNLKKVITEFNNKAVTSEDNTKSAFHLTCRCNDSK